MSQTSPNLMMLLLGGGGVLSVLTLIGSFAGFLIKKHVETLDQGNKNLTSENERLKASLAKAETDTKTALAEISDLFTVLETLRESSLSANDAARLKRILVGIRRIQSMQEGFEAYKTAARWLNYRKIEWTKEAVKAAVQAHPELVPRSLRKQFQQDISGYLDWVYTSLYVYGHPNVPIRNFIPQPIIQSTFPYIAAIDYLKNNEDRKELTVDQSLHLENMLDELSRKIHSEFNN